MCRGILVSLIFLFSSELTATEPNSVIEELMSEPVSMFDWGMYHFERDIKDLVSKRVPSRDGTPAVAWVAYAREEERIRVFVYGVGLSPDRESAETWCNEATKELQEYLFEVREGSVPFVMSFRHETDPIGGGMREDTWNRLAQITTIHVQTRYADLRTTLVCESDYFNAKPTYRVESGYRADSE